MRRKTNKIAIPPICATIVFFAIFANAQSQSSQIGTIAGKVVDAKTNEPLKNVNVFLTNTMLGDATDKKGHYEIENIPFGMYELTVSMIGYEVQSRQIRVINSVKMVENFYLQPRILRGEEVTITAMDPATREKYMKIFQRIFLGASHEELHCTLTNPHAVKLRYTDSTRVLDAYANEPLIVENRATGFKIDFILDTFRCEMIATQLSFTFKGRAHFKELDPRNSKEKEVWHRNRLIAYHGSLRHFLTALATDRIYESGFNIYRTADPTPGRPTPLDIPKTKTGAREILFATQEPHQNRLQFDDFLEVTFNLEGELQTSWLALNKEYAILNIQGVIIEPFDPTNVRGHWAYESLTELLPRDFNPEESAKIKPVYIADTRDYYQEGRELADMGNWKSALRTWQIGKDGLDIQTRYNPKIGFSFIELTTENDAQENYEEACRIYYWALSEENMRPFQAEFAAEVERIAPLLENTVAEQWREDAKKSQPELLQKIKTFWIEKDPTPATILNERLIEHWQRIAFARKNFRKAQTTPYGTDDRGLIYVKYGKPDRQRALTLGNNQDEMYRWGATRDNVFQQENRIQITGEPVNSLQEREMLRKTIGKFNYFPECEVWVYRDQLEDENTVYLFGPRNGKGVYGLRNGLEEFIPDEAFHRFRTGEFKGILPGTLIQMMYYRDLAALDSHFADRYSELESSWQRADAQGEITPNINYLKGLHNLYKTIDTHDAPRLYAPKEQSDVEDKLNKIELTTIRTRILDDHIPKLVFVAYAIPENISKPISATEQEITTVPTDDLTYTLISRDRNLEETGRFTGKPFSRQDFTTVVTIDHRRNNAHYTLAIHSEKDPGNSLVAEDITQPFSAGKEHFGLTEPLDPDPDKLEVSDLVIGVQSPPDFEINRLPFPIVPGRMIWRNDPMQVYLEVYHLKPDKEGIAHFNLDFRVIKLEKKKEKLIRKEVIASSFDYDSPTMNSKEHFGVSIANLEAGDYEIEVEVKDPESGQKKRRNVVFEIRE